MRKTPQKVQKALAQFERLRLKCEEAHGGDRSKMTLTERTSLTKYEQRLEKFFVGLSERTGIDQLKQAEARNFWRNEYLKRKFFFEAREAGCSDFTSHELFMAISEWRSRRDARIEASDALCDCDRARCRYNCKSKAGRQSLNYPFFYSKHACKCEFTDAIKSSVEYWHNYKLPHIETAIQVWNNRGLYNNIDEWSTEFTQTVEIIQNYSYRYGQFGHDLFSLTSPIEIIRSKGEIPVFEHSESFLLEGEEECDPRLMHIMRIDPNMETLIKERAEEAKSYELRVGINLQAPNLSLRREMAKIKKTLEAYIQGKLSNPNVYDTELNSIIFSFNPSDASFSIDKALKVSKLAVAGYVSIIGAWNVLGEDYQAYAHEAFKHITTVKNYQATNAKRAIGLYVWDQIQYLGIPKKNAISSLTNTKLYETAIDLSKDALELRVICPEDQMENGQEAVGTEDDYIHVSRCYQLADDCIRYGKLLTEAKAKRLRSSQPANFKKK